MRRLGRRYRLDEQVGQGGMAVVWRARDDVLRRTVAVKMLPPGAAPDVPSRARVRAEALAAARLNHPNIARVYDYGVARQGPRRRAPYLVMEFVDGESLAARLADAGPLPPPAALRICAEVARALAAAHAAGLVHRDVKPGNVMLCDDGVKVVDFGVAATVGQDPADTAGAVLGTPAYMAPEQIAGGPAAPAADVYALGLLLAECLTARPVWRGPDAASVLAARSARATAELPPPADLPGPVGDLLRRCLAPDPADRPDSAAVAAALSAAARDGADSTSPPPAPTSPPPAPTRALPAAPPVEPAGATGTAAARAARPGSRRRVAALVTAPACVLMAVLVAHFTGVVTTPEDAAEGAPAGTAEPVSASDCVARYVERLRRDGRFTAELTVRNTGPTALAGWSLAFALPADQRVGRVDGAQWHQDGRRVRLDQLGRLAPGAVVSLTMRGGGADPATAADRREPRRFLVDGVPCRRTVTHVGSGGAPSGDPPADGGGERGGGPPRGGLGGGTPEGRPPPAAPVTPTGSATPTGPPTASPTPTGPPTTSPTPTPTGPPTASPTPTGPPTASPTPAGPPTGSPRPSPTAPPGPTGPPDAPDPPAPGTPVGPGGQPDGDGGSTSQPAA